MTSSSDRTSHNGGNMGLYEVPCFLADVVVSRSLGMNIPRSATAESIVVRRIDAFMAHISLSKLRVARTNDAKLIHASNNGRTTRQDAPLAEMSSQ